MSDVAELEARIERLEAENTELRSELVEYREQNEREKAEIRRDVHQHIEVRTDDDETPGLEDVWIAGQPLGKIINGIQAKVNSGATSESAQSDESATKTESETPMEQVIRAGAQGVMFDVTPSVRRAEAIAEHLSQWASKAPNGLVIKDNLKTLLETATGERLAWNQVYRAAEALKEFTAQAVEFTKHRRFGWILVAEPAIVQKLSQASSVGER